MFSEGVMTMFLIIGFPALSGLIVSMIIMNKKIDKEWQEWSDMWYKKGDEDEQNQSSES